MNLCPNCGEQDEEKFKKVKDDLWHCVSCDTSYTVSKGKPVIAGEAPNFFDKVTDKLKSFEDRLTGVEQKTEPSESKKDFWEG